MRMRQSRTFWSLVFAGLLAGCAGANPEHYVDSGTVDAAPKPDVKPDLRYNLTIVGWNQLRLDPGQQVNLLVRYTKNEESVANAAISFVFRGNPGGSRLSTLTAVTNAYGYAETTLTAGQERVLYRVEASTINAGPVGWDIDVTKGNAHPDAQTLAGTFTLDNKFDIQGKFTGSKFADALNFIEEVSNDPDDPGQFIVDIILDEIKDSVDNDVFSQFVNVFKPALYGKANEKLKDIPLVQNLKQIAADLSALARRFRIESRIVSAVPQDASLPMTVDHLLDRVSWTLRSKTATYTFAQLGMAQPRANNLELVLNQTNRTDLTVAKHSFELNVGAFLLVGLNNMIIPEIESDAASIADLIKGWIDCQKIAESFDKATDNLAGTSIWKAACEAGLTMAGSYVERQILQVGNDVSKIEIKGQSKIKDINQDGFYDTLENGLWIGTYALEGNAIVIAGPTNGFVGTRTK